MTAEAARQGAVLLATGMVGGYGGMDILHGVDLEVRPGEITVIVGPNGAGKSTAMKAVFGLLHLREGTVSLLGDDITNLAPTTLVRRGMAMVPQDRNVFPNLSVHENLEMGAFVRDDPLDASLDRVYALFPDLVAKRRQPAGELSGGQRQMVAIGRALMVEPKLLLLDEPTAGLSPKVMDEIFERIAAINRDGVGVLMVEQNARQSLAIAHRGYVLVHRPQPLHRHRRRPAGQPRGGRGVSCGGCRGMQRCCSRVAANCRANCCHAWVGRVARVPGACRTMMDFINFYLIPGWCWAASTRSARSACRCCSASCASPISPTAT